MKSWTNNNTAWDELKRETGFDYYETWAAFNNLIEYIGGDYHAFTHGSKPDETAIIDNALKHMGAYDGTIYRGMRIFDGQVADMYANLKAGDIISPGVLTSWTSDFEVAQKFSGSFSDMDTDSVRLICKNNKSAVGVQHISKFGSGEAEVLAPSTTKWAVESVKVEQKHAKKYVNGQLIDQSYGGKMITIMVKER